MTIIMHATKVYYTFKKLKNGNYLCHRFDFSCGSYISTNEGEQTPEDVQFTYDHLKKFENVGISIVNGDDIFEFF